MTTGEFISGQQLGWGLLEKLGEGDAGEVYRVESLLEKKLAILKRPHRSAFSSDIVRQAAQIETESRILRALEKITLSGRNASLTAPRLLDQSKPGAEFSERFFIVIERAPGVDLNTLARAALFGSLDPNSLQALDESTRRFVETLAQSGEVPQLLLLRALAALLDMLEKLHDCRVQVDGSEYAGVIWNDVKPEHLFWDPAKAAFTIIDWGNGQFLEPDGTTRDRRYSRLDDDQQLLQEMGRFVAMTSPSLHARLEWPEGSVSVDTAAPALAALKARTLPLLEAAQTQLSEARRREADLYSLRTPTADTLQELQAIQEEIIASGELPDYASAERFCAGLAAALIAEGQSANLPQVCLQAAQLPGAQAYKWKLLAEMAGLAEKLPETAQAAWSQALTAGLTEDWAGALWSLLAAAGEGNEPVWWEDMAHHLRSLALTIGPDLLTPYVAVNRIVYTLQSAAQKLRDYSTRRLPGGELPEDAGLRGLQAQSYEDLIRVLREEVAYKWKMIEPDPPDHHLAYSDLERVLPEIENLMPEAYKNLVRALDQPRAQVKIVLDAWGRKEFETARRGLRRLFLWDPDRRRVLNAEAAILAAPLWLERVRQGPPEGEALADFLTRMELEGRNLRGAVGSARWLDSILDIFAQVRKGARASDLMLETPELMNEVGWMVRWEPRTSQPVAPQRPVRLERTENPAQPEPTVRGVREGWLGQDRDLFLTEPLDTWVPEARGSSARVFTGFLRTDNNRLRQAAVKLMRHDQVEYALPLFREEVDILSHLRDVPGVVAMLECGFFKLDGDQTLPPDQRPIPARSLTGAVLRFGPAEAGNFLRLLNEKTQEGWLAYLALDKQNRDENLMTLCDAGYTRGRFLPVNEALRLSIQICDLLQEAHQRNIVYRDHKILHYYWLEDANGILTIDWNVAKHHPEGLTKAEKNMDLVQFGARALHHILTGRVAPGALPLGPTRPEEIERAQHSYRVQWTYDDQRLPGRVRDILERALSGNYFSAKDLRQDLFETFVALNGE